jgi:RNA polymerase sigma factor (sigma-70 family)
MHTAHGKEPVFDEVYISLFPTIFRVSYRITGDAAAAEDLCQECFIRFMNKRGALPNLEQAKFWLIRVVKNLSLNYEKKKLRERTAFGKLQRLSPGIAESGEKQVLKDELRENVQKALDDLPPNLRVPLVFKEYAGLSYKEIANVLGITESNVKIRLFRARARLERILVEGNVHVS